MKDFYFSIVLLITYSSSLLFSSLWLLLFSSLLLLVFLVCQLVFCYWYFLNYIYIHFNHSCYFFYILLLSKSPPLTSSFTWSLRLTLFLTLTPELTNILLSFRFSSSLSKFILSARFFPFVAPQIYIILTIMHITET